MASGTALGATLGAGLGAGVVLCAVPLIGLGAAGPIAGGWFAAHMGAGLAAGSGMALLQSAVMTGSATILGVKGGASLGAIVGGVVSYSKPSNIKQVSIVVCPSIVSFIRKLSMPSLPSYYSSFIIHCDLSLSPPSALVFNSVRKQQCPLHPSPILSSNIPR